jgi:hypothetical protein
MSVTSPADGPVRGREAGRAVDHQVVAHPDAGAALSLDIEHHTTNVRWSFSDNHSGFETSDNHSGFETGSPSSRPTHTIATLGARPL